MKILIMSDDESELLLKYYKENRLDEVELVLSAGDLPYLYLQTVKANIKAPLYFVKGNHDKFKVKMFDREFVEWKCFEYHGIRIAGIGCRDHSGRILSEKKMENFLKKLYKKTKKFHGVDIVISHYPMYGTGDGIDETHKGFQAIKEFVKKVSPKYFVYGHSHLNYDRNDRIINFEDTVLINAYEKYVLDYK